MKKLFVIVIVLSLLATNALALQEVAGTIVISTPIGGTNSSQYGLLNDGNETITVGLRADGDVASYLSFPANVTLEPEKLVYTNITATIPADYGTTGNITGHLYALQEGSSGGQVQINVQMMKSVVISVYGQPSQVSSGQTNQVNSSQSNSEQTNQGTSSEQTSQGTSQSNEANTPSGLVTMITNNYPIVILAIVIVVLAVIIIIRIRRDSW